MDINIENNNLEVSLSQSSSGGTLDHAQLINRDAKNQHPIEAITGLTRAGDGSKFLSDDGTYKKIETDIEIKTINNQSLLGEGNINIEDFIMINSPDEEPELKEKLLSAIDEDGNIVKPLYVMLGNQALSLEVVERNGEGLVFKFHSLNINFFDEGSSLEIQEHYIILFDDGNVAWDSNGSSIPDTSMFDQKADKIKIENPEITTIAITANTYYQFGEVSVLDIRLAEITDETTLHEYMFEFVSGDIGTTLILPGTIKWLEEPTIEANKTYQCSIVNNIGVLLGV